MHSTYAGDGKDHAKGFVLASLYASIPRLDLRVDPMFSDAPLALGSDGLDAYCRFLRVNAKQVFNNELQYRQQVTRNGHREDYFKPHYGQDYDLFLDPDTGFGGGGRHHVPWRVLPLLVPDGTSRVLAVFQSRHRTRGFERHFSDRHLPAYDGFWVDLGQQAYVLFLSVRNNPRLATFRRALEKAYHPYEKRRVNTK